MFSILGSAWLEPRFWAAVLLRACTSGRFVGLLPRGRDHLRLWVNHLFLMAVGREFLEIRSSRKIAVIFEDDTYCCVLPLLLILLSFRLSALDLPNDMRRRLEPRSWSLSASSEWFGLMFSYLSSYCKLLVSASTGCWSLSDRESVYSSSSPES